MPEDNLLSKRHLLRLGGASLVTALAGCGSSEDGDTTQNTPTSTNTATDTPTTQAGTSTPTEQQTTTESSVDVEAVGQEFLAAFTSQEFDQAADMLSQIGATRVQQTIPTLYNGEFSATRPALQRAWLGLTSQHAGFSELGDVSANAAEQTVTGVVRCQETEQPISVEVSDDGMIRNVAFPAEYSQPAYASSADVDQRSLSFDAGGRTFEGTLALPADASEAPCLVLVQGTRLYDRNATVGPNQVFRDLAEGLATRGVATFRYDRRRRTDVDGPITPENIIVSDAVAALQRVATVEEVRADAVYVAGHSAGGRWAPRIADRHGNLAGMVILDTLGLPYLETFIRGNEEVLEQEYLVSKERQRLQQQAEAARRIQENGLPEDQDQTPVGPRSWVEAHLDYDMVATADGAGSPTFVVQGGRPGPQVKQASIERWRSGVTTAGSNVIGIDELNHYLQSGQQPGVTAEYLLFHDNVAGAVIEDLSGWVASTSG